MILFVGVVASGAVNCVLGVNMSTLLSLLTQLGSISADNGGVVSRVGGYIIHTSYIHHANNASKKGVTPAVSPHCTWPRHNNGPPRPPPVTSTCPH